MKMSKTLKNKWVKALRSGDYKQADGTLCNGTGFCCLGVLEHVAMDGEVEIVTVPDFGEQVGDFLNMPSKEFYAYADITVDRDVLDTLQEMNDDMHWESSSDALSHRNDFNTIADFIEEHVKTK